MFLLDVYKFCESYDWFGVKHLASFIYKHRECERLARAANMEPKLFAATISKEFIGRMCGYGYLNLENGKATCYGSHKRPFGFDFKSFTGESDQYVKMIVHIGEMSDDELFK
ncbi:hypothetical protein [Hafnia phage Pocis76]|uniref:Uncharacterized protein n=1 Tax=Hafnia phage Pocis76 TaxID=2831174 RepID=A0A8E7FN87_9CAUD|nr:hypothetical protein [Hafnia phage Pocis76]